MSWAAWEAREPVTRWTGRALSGGAARGSLEGWVGRRDGAMCCLGPPWEAEEPKDCKNRTVA